MLLQMISQMLIIGTCVFHKCEIVYAAWIYRRGIARSKVMYVFILIDIANQVPWVLHQFIRHQHKCTWIFTLSPENMLPKFIFTKYKGYRIFPYIISYGTALIFKIGIWKTFLNVKMFLFGTSELTLMSDVIWNGLTLIKRKLKFFFVEYAHIKTEERKRI